MWLVCMSLRFEVVSTLGSTQSGYRMVSVDLWKSVFCQRGNFLSRRVATGEVVFVGTCPTIEIVGSWLSRRFAMGVWFVWGSSHD